jgi:hypothetical protein
MIIPVIHSYNKNGYSQTGKKYNKDQYPHFFIADRSSLAQSIGLSFW